MMMMIIIMIIFLLLKGSKRSTVQGAPRKPNSERKKQEFQNKASDLRKRISIAKAELKTLRENIKLTKKGKRNRTILLEEYKVISSAELVNYMEKKKSQLRKLKAKYLREKKQHEARSLNNQFKQDVRRFMQSLQR